MIKETKKFVWMMGGLGNVLFQGFAGYLLQKNHSVYYVNNLTKSNFITNKILKWTIHDTSISEIIFDNQLHFSNLKTLVKLISISFKKNNFLNDKCHYLFESEDSFSSMYTHYFGYFQSKTFILERKNIFLDYCNLIHEKLIKSLPKEQISDVVVHYRWGDSDWAKENTEYYEKVKNELIKNNYRNIVVVTDDLKQAHCFFSEINNISIQRKSISEDFSQIFYSKTLFIAPSTFSWWACHLGVAKNQVFIPEKIYDKIGFFSNCNVSIL